MLQPRRVLQVAPAGPVCVTYLSPRYWGRKGGGVRGERGGKRRGPDGKWYLHSKGITEKHVLNNTWGFPCVWVCLRVSVSLCVCVCARVCVRCNYMSGRVFPSLVFALIANEAMLK